MYLLTVCIPTYKRSSTLKRCIESVASQIDKYDLLSLVSIYVADDASPDNTVDVLNQFSSLNYFDTITRADNLGMNVNIKTMFGEIKNSSEYQLIITDDDYLQPDTLNEIVDFLKGDDAIKDIHAIWTPRYSYTEDGQLDCIACKPFKKTTLVKPSSKNVSKYMDNGFVLSGLIIQVKFIDYEFWAEYDTNAYFPVIFFGDLLLQNGAYFWNKNIVHHTVMNHCHWERWGKNDIVIKLRKFSDYINTCKIMARKINGRLNLLQYYLFLIPLIYNLLVMRLSSGEFHLKTIELVEAVDGLKEKGFLHFDSKLKLLVLFTLLINVSFSIVKILITRILILFQDNIDKIERYRNRVGININMLKAAPLLAKTIIFRKIL